MWDLIYHINKPLCISSVRTIIDKISKFPNYTKVISGFKNSLTECEQKTGSRLGIDTHADSSCAGRHVRPLEYIHGKKFSVTPFHNSYEPKKNVGMINGVVAVDIEDGTGFILELNNFLDFTQSMEDSILVPMQARQNGVIIDDVPKNLCHYGTSTQSMFVPQTNFKAPIEFNGPIPFVRIRYPTDSDLDEYEWIELTSTSEWIPYSNELSTVSSTCSYANITNYTNQDLRRPINLYSKIRSDMIISSVKVNKRAGELSPETLSKLWKIPLRLAKKTLNVTTSNYIRTNEGRLSRRFRTDIFQKRYKHLGGMFSRFYTDTIFFKVETLDLFKCAQIFCNKANYSKIYPMSSKSEAHNALSSLVHDVGIPSELHSDDAKELCKGIMKKKMVKYGIFHTMTEPYSPWENYAEDCIRVIKNWARYFMQLKNTPIRLIDHALLYASELRNLTASTILGTKGRTPFEITYGYSPDISEYVTFEWYEYVWYWQPNEPQRQQLGRWLGVAEHIGNGLTYKVINGKAEVISRSTVISLSSEDYENDDVKSRLRALDQSIHSRIGSYDKSLVQEGEIIDDNLYTSIFKGDDDPHPNHLVEFMEDFEVEEEESLEMNQGLSEELNDNYIGTKVLLPQFGRIQEAIVKSRKRSHDGKTLLGQPNSNPLLDSRIYQVEFPDGGIGEFTTNIIAESLISNLDVGGYDTGLMEGIISHRKMDSAVSKSDGYIIHNGVKRKVITTKGWDMQIKWKDGSTSWVPLKDVKLSNPVDTAEYAIWKGIDKEPAFSWWVPTIIRQRQRMVKRINVGRKIRKKTKFGIVIPTDIEEAKLLDDENNNNLWEQAIKKELDKVRVAFQLLEDDESPLPGSKAINYHFIFDVKMNLTCKARLVAGGHLNHNVPRHITYSSVVSKESVRIVFMLAALNNLDLLSGDVTNAYLNAKPREKCYVEVTDPLLFGPSAVGKKAQIVRALYGMKSSGAAWRDMISTFLKYEMKFNMCEADNDIWFKRDNYSDKDSNSGAYYTYICIYVDDILICSERPERYMNQFNERFNLKKGSIKSPDIYLGADFRKKRLDNGKHIWITGCNSYIKEALRIADGILDGSGIKVAGAAKHPFSTATYRPELDVTPFCDTEQINTYQQLIGIGRWLVELGRVDIQLEITKLSSFLVSPRIGHMHQALHLFKYLKNHSNSWIPMDPEKVDVRWTGPAEHSPNARRKMMKKIYQDATEDLPINAPAPLGKSVQINCYVDADHAGDKITRRSQSGILIYVNMALVSWFSKKQNTVESSTFGSEYIATRIAVEKVKAIRYKLRMMGVPLDGPCNMFADNESVVKASMNPESTLSKKHVSIAYHLTREAFAAKIVDIYFIPSKENLADLLTKVLSTHDRRELLRSIFW